MMSKSQAGVSLVITFLIMTIMLSIVVSLSVILFSQIHIIGSIGNSVSSFYAADTGIEKTVYFDRKQIPQGATRGFCSICTTCSSTECTSCNATPLATNGCDAATCNNCEITYTSTYDNRTYSVDAKITPDNQDPSLSVFTVDSKGLYQDSTRAVELQLTSQPPLQQQTPPPAGQ